MILFIFVMDVNRLIGKDNDLLWYLFNDFVYFKKVILGYLIIMGWKIYELIGCLFLNWKNIVVILVLVLEFLGCMVVSLLKDVLDICLGFEECFVIGGVQFYIVLFLYVDRLYMMKIYYEFEGDCYFFEFDEINWKLVFFEWGIKDEKNLYDYEFLVYEKKNFFEMGGF